MNAVQSSARATSALTSEVTARGETVYFGTVYPLRDVSADASFVYERRVEAGDHGWTSTHVTREPAGAVAIAESALHSAEYALDRYTLHRDQLGRSGSVRVDGDTVRFQLTDLQGRTRTETERQEAPVVVGPTLVGYVFRHLDQLEAGSRLEVRLAVLDRLETIGFRLEAVRGEPRRITVKMKPTGFLFGLFVDPLYFTFDAGTKKLLRLEGRVPPKSRDGKRLRDFDARVEYAYVSATYR